MKKIVFLFIIFVFITACSNQVKNETPPQTTISNESEQYQNKVQELESEVDKLKEELEKTKPHVLNYKANLTVWSEDEILNGLAKRNKKFQGISWFTYLYRDDGSYYDLIGPIFPIDPFYPIVYEKRNRELNVSHLRIFNLDPGEKGLATEKYEKYLSSIDKATRLNKNLNCMEQIDCRNTRLITCTSSNQTLYIWYAHPYLFTARDDNQEAYKTFLLLYCEEAKSGLLEFTGNVIRNLKSFFKLT
ncbi:hypothetical protein HYV88_03770 [Candidatus Woesearchaeota archaeon]|nr:hypothetical protein [Candidatus Woesearchaeota archaeon]